MTIGDGDFRVAVLMRGQDNRNMNQPPRAISLDLDNTLWDTPPVLDRAEESLQSWLAVHAPRVAQRHDRTSLAQARASVVAERPDRAHDFTYIRTESLRRVALQCGYSADLGESAFEVFIAARNRIDPFADVPGALAWLARRLPVYALTNGNACVHRVGLGEHFAGSFEPVAVGCAKPDRRIFDALVAASRVERQSIWHVGDDPVADVDGASRAGLVSVWMNRTGAEWPADLRRPDIEVADMEGLVARVEASL
jgi:FMN hydrolase / 5-amino-6-(5-phospho-D-ribitylamino)uracil phosphatase